MGNTLDVQSGRWTNRNAGIGAGIDSFYEYLFKAYVLFGNHRFLHMFESSYASVMEHLRLGPWYLEASMTSGHPSHVQFNSLQAFWPVGYSSALVSLLTYASGIASAVTGGHRFSESVLLAVEAIRSAARALLTRLHELALHRTILPSQA